jgi:hypothetical protein
MDVGSLAEQQMTDQKATVGGTFEVDQTNRGSLKAMRATSEELVIVESERS